MRQASDGRARQSLAKGLRLLGLTRGWVIYWALLVSLASALIVGRLLDIPNSLRGVALHVLLLAWLVLLQAQFWAWLPGHARWRHLSTATVAGLFLFALIALHFANFASFEFLHTGPSLSLVPAYLAHMHHVSAAAGVSFPLIALFTGLLLIAAVALCLWLFGPDEARPPRSIPALVLIALGLLVHSAQLPYFKKHEFLHRLAYGFPTEIAPRSLMDLSKPHPRPRYADAKQTISPRPLVLITIDSLRPDATQLYGNPTLNTPFLAKLHRQGKLRVYDNAHSICAVSYCGLLGIIASRSWEGLQYPPDNIADALADNGYKSHFILSGAHDSYFGLGRKYGPNVAFRREGTDAAGEYPNDDRLIDRWIAELPQPSGSRNFYWFHLMDVHNLGLRSEPDVATIRDPVLLARMREQGSALKRYAQRYHDGIVTSDRTVARIFDWLDDTGQIDDALVIITADHGEYLGEGGRTAHGGVPWGVLSHVPLAIYDARGADWPARDPVSTLDIAPTFLKAIGARIPLDFEGVALQETTSRCAVPAGSQQTRSLIGARGKPRYWRDVDGGEYLERPDSIGPLSHPVRTGRDRKIAMQLQSCNRRK